MDEEDIREEEESRILATSDEFTGFGTENDAMRKRAAIDLFRPPGETVGSKLLKKMGWREGAGIGPRVRRTAKLEDENDDNTTATHLFAPDDVQVICYPRKSDYKGLGYDGELPISENTPSENHKLARRMEPEDQLSGEDAAGSLFSEKAKSAQMKKKTGFGVGVLNDDGSDDDDPYSIGPRISYSKTIGGDKKPKPKSKALVSSANPLLRKKPTFIPKKLASLKGVLRKCYDGRLPLDGFVLADELETFGTMSLQDERYRPPEVPDDWHSAMSAAVEAETTPNFVSTAEAARSSNLNAKARASVLGELQLPGKSVFDFLTPAARDRLVTASGQENLPAAGNEGAPNKHEVAMSEAETLQSLVPRLDREVAIQALERGVAGWMPYVEDEDKRSRYRSYLEIQAGLRSAVDLPRRAEHMRKEDWILEMNEFARAAEVFRPISGLMASRFTSSSAVQGSDGKATDGASLLSNPKAKPENSAEAAAKLGMFGPLTRSVINFYPTRLLCKRFGVSMPMHAEAGSGASGNGAAFVAPEPGLAASQFRSFASAGFQHDEVVEFNEKRAGASPVQQLDLSLVKTEPNVMDPDKNEAIEQERPGQAVFRAIFGSDDEDD